MLPNEVRQVSTFSWHLNRPFGNSTRLLFCLFNVNGLHVSASKFFASFNMLAVKISGGVCHPWTVVLVKIFPHKRNLRPPHAMKMYYYPDNALLYEHL